MSGIKRNRNPGEGSRREAVRLAKLHAHQEELYKDTPPPPVSRQKRRGRWSDRQTHPYRAGQKASR